MDNELNQKLKKAMDEYNKHFEEPIYLMANDPPDLEKFIPALYRCIETNTPYEYPKLPEGCIA